MTDLPEPACRYGYTRDQLAAILAGRLDEFHRWFHGQTGAICDGREWDFDACQWRDTGCGPHGMAVYSSDLRRFLDRRDPV